MVLRWAVRWSKVALRIDRRGKDRKRGEGRREGEGAVGQFIKACLIDCLRLQFILGRARHTDESIAARSKGQHYPFLTEFMVLGKLIHWLTGRQQSIPDGNRTFMVGSIPL